MRCEGERGKVRSLLNNSFWDPKPYNPLAQSFREEEENEIEVIEYIPEVQPSTQRKGSP